MNLKTNENGRSMIEMLGVLAIVGILSIGGIAGFNKAMTKHKLNQAIEEYNYILSFVEAKHNEFIKIPSERGDNIVYLTDILKAMGVVSNNMKITGNSREGYLYDVFGNKFYIRTIPPKIEFAMYLNAGKDGVFSTVDVAKEICLPLYMNVLFPRYQTLDATYLIMDQGSTTLKYVFYGENLCASWKKCIKNITINEVLEMCNACENDKYCRIGAKW